MLITKFGLHTTKRPTNPPKELFVLLLFQLACKDDIQSTSLYLNKYFITLSSTHGCINCELITKEILVLFSIPPTHPPGKVRILSKIQVRNTQYIIKALWHLVKAVRHLVKAVRHLVKAPRHLVKAPRHLVKAPRHLVKAPRHLVILIILHSKIIACCIRWFLRDISDIDAQIRCFLIFFLCFSRRAKLGDYKSVKKGW